LFVRLRLLFSFPGWLCITFAPGWIGLHLRGAKGPGLSKTLATTERSLMGVVGIPLKIITRANQKQTCVQCSICITVCLRRQRHFIPACLFERKLYVKVYFFL